MIIEGTEGQVRRVEMTEKVTQGKALTRYWSNLFPRSTSLTTFTCVHDAGVGVVNELCTGVNVDLMHDR